MGLRNWLQFGVLGVTATRPAQLTVLALQLVFTTVAVLLLWLPNGDTFDPHHLSLALSALLFWSLASWYVATGAGLDPYILFLLSAFLFNAGQALLEAIGANSVELLRLFSEDVTRHTLLLVLAGLCAMHFGALSAVALARRPEKPIRADRTDAWLRGLGWALVLVSIVPAYVWLSENVAAVAAGGYASLYDRDADFGLAAGPFILTGFLMPGALMLSVSDRRHLFDRGIAAILVISFVLIQFYLGYRSAAVMPLIAWAWLRHRAVRRIPAALLLAVGTVVALVVFPVVGEIRNLSGWERSFDSAADAFTALNNPAIASVQEMGSTMDTIAHTLTFVPSVRPFDRGEGYLYGLLTIVPNAFWDVHPTIARGNASDWLVKAVDPYSAARGGGLGFSCIAEAYLNFGDSGVLLAMCLVGLAIAALTTWAERTGTAAAFALVAIVLAHILRFPRDEIAGIVRPIVWYGIVPYLCVVLMPAAGRVLIKTRPTIFRRLPATTRP
jgi:oligosaccharide repeat unit polymerase